MQRFIYLFDKLLEEQIVWSNNNDKNTIGGCPSIFVPSDRFEEVPADRNLFSQQMKFEYHFEVSFVKLAVKQDLLRDFRLLLTVDLEKGVPRLKNKYFHLLKLDLNQRVLSLKHLQTFHFAIDEEDIQREMFSLQIRDEISQQTIEIIPLETEQMIRRFNAVGKTVNEKRYEGHVINLNYLVSISKIDVQNDPNTEELSGPSGNDIRQTLNRTKRPPELLIQKKSQLRESQKKNQEQSEAQVKQTQQFKPLFKGIADDPPQDQKPIVVNIIEQKAKDQRIWQPLSAIPHGLSLFIRRKVLHEPEINQVKELLESHHPTVEQGHQTRKLSLKLKTVIALLIMGFFVLIMDMVKQQAEKLMPINGQKQDGDNHPRPASKQHSKPSHYKSEKKKAKPKKTKETKISKSKH